MRITCVSFKWPLKRKHTMYITVYIYRHGSLTNHGSLTTLVKGCVVVVVVSSCVDSSQTHLEQNQAVHISKASPHGENRSVSRTSRAVARLQGVSASIIFCISMGLLWCAGSALRDGERHTNGSLGEEQRLMPSISTYIYIYIFAPSLCVRVNGV